MVFFPPCKINLGLQVISKRTDGYHNLVTCYYPVPWYDVAEIIPSLTFSFSSSGLPISGKVDDNLCVKAYKLIQKDFDIPSIKLHLHKIIPMGAGLGGGSSDAAWTLRGLNQQFDLHLNDDQLKIYAEHLGSDCAFFIQDKPTMGTGRGEILTTLSIDLSGKSVILVKPAVHISTAEAYAGITPEKPTVDLKEILEKHNISEWKELLNNDFEKPVFQRHPIIGDIKKSLYDQGALYASMSGSGSAVFGIFDEAIDLKHVFSNCTYFSAVL